MDILESFTHFSFKFKWINNQQKIFDIIRKKWVFITPEEWVRQHIIHYFVFIKKYPKSIILIEKSIKIGDKINRFDIIVSKNNVPWMVVECKSLDTKITDKVLQQIMGYNYSLQAPYLFITNTAFNYCFEINNGRFLQLYELPDY